MHEIGYTGFLIEVSRKLRDKARALAKRRSQKLQVEKCELDKGKKPI